MPDQTKTKKQELLSVLFKNHSSGRVVGSIAGAGARRPLWRFPIGREVYPFDFEPTYTRALAFH